jgi:hypothetical protein
MASVKTLSALHRGSRCDCLATGNDVPRGQIHYERAARNGKRWQHHRFDRLRANQVWLEIAMLPADLITNTQRLALSDTLPSPNRNRCG